MAPVKIAFISGHELGRCALQGILASPEYQNGLIELTQLFSLHPRNSVGVCGYFDFSDYTDIPVTWFDTVTDDHVIQALDAVEHHYLIVIGLSSLVPKRILEAPKRHCKGSAPYSEHYGAIGMHPTLLPVGRGRAPIPWTIIKQLTASGVSMYQLVEAADAGPLIHQTRVSLEPSETATTLFSKVAEAHHTLGTILAGKMSRRQVNFQPQDEFAATRWPRRTPKDSWLNFGRDAQTLLRLIRAQTDPYPNAFFAYQGMRILVQDAQLITGAPAARAGTILSVSDNNLPSIATGDGTLLITQLSTDTAKDVPPFKVGHVIGEVRK